jgi:hypothetical protein
MTKGNQHTIGTIEYELRVNNEKKAVKIQEEISELSRNKIPGILEDLFDQIDHEGKYIVIDRIELDLGKFDFQDFKLNFSSVLQKSLSQKLASLQAGKQEITSDQPNHYKEENDFHILEFFLKTGKLPWYAEGSNPDFSAIVKKLIRKKEPAFINLVLSQARNLNFQKRISALVPENYYKEFIALFTDRPVWKDDSTLKLMLALFRIFPFADAGLSLFRQLLFQSIIETLVSKEIHSNFDFEISVFKQLAFRLHISFDVFISNARISIKKIHSNKKYPSEMMTNLELLLKYSEKENSKTKKNKKIKKSDHSEEETEKREKEETSFLISNAGIILINPFLKELFTLLKLLKNGHFINEEAQYKAIHLIQYAAIGRTGHPEYSLLLNKILCGFPVENAIPLHIELSKSEKTQTTRMISAVIKNWNALKNTSVPSFRTAFLQRNGLLKKTENGWNLSVERTAYDVLLNRLPWQYEQVKLHWMTSTVSTIW